MSTTMTISLQQFLTPGMQMEWLVAYRELLEQHIENVRAAGAKLNVPAQQLARHDASKWTHREFPAYARQFHGDAGDPAGFAAAWLHHQNHNPHHWEHWITRSGKVGGDTGVDETHGCLEMPECYVREMVADWMGASRSYTGSWSVRPWWTKKQDTILLHPKTRLLVNIVLQEVDYGDE